MQSVIFLELNELNFKYAERYISQGYLPNFKRLIDRHGFSETSSETEYENLEPWIQWVTAHTGLSLKEHGVFRLGDIIESDLIQIWERLSTAGLSVGAVSPMNAKCRLANWDFFVPDPWTKTPIVAPHHVICLYRAIVQAVNDNAHSRLSITSILNLLYGLSRNARIESFKNYVKCIFSFKEKPWMKAIFLDVMLYDTYFKLLKKHKTDFSTIFLNASAHIQHHYLFSSAAYDGDLRNPDWYVRKGVDPLLDVYKAYDLIVGSACKNFPDHRVMIATGLHQDPHPEITYYWRLKEHDHFLRKIGIHFLSVEPRMSRDFIVKFANSGDAVCAEGILRLAKASDGQPLFEVDNRGDSIFAMLTYPGDVGELAWYCVGNEKMVNLIQDVSLVAIKNGCHNGTGYFLDTGVKRHDDDVCRIGLASIPAYIESAFGLQSTPLKS